MSQWEKIVPSEPGTAEYMEGARDLQQEEAADTAVIKRSQPREGSGNSYPDFFFYMPSDLLWLKAPGASLEAKRIRLAVHTRQRMWEKNELRNTVAT